MPERNIRIKIFIDDSNIKALANMTLLLQKAAAAEKALTGQALKKNKVLKKQTGVVKKDSKALDDVNKKTRTWTQQIGKNIGKVLEWTVATTAIFGTIQALRTGIEDLVGVEFAMAGLTKVMRDGETRAKGLKSELLKLGQQYGELGDEVIDASTEWARLQLSTFEIAENARTALLGQAVAEMEIVQGTKLLIASMQQFDQTSLANIRTLDMWNELSNQMAVRALDLAQATGRAGSVIHNAGDEMAFLNGMTAALVQATGRSGQEIGNAIRTFGTYAFRLRSIGTIQRETGIIIQNSVGQHRSFSDIISELALRWDTFTDATQRSIAQSVAGTRRQNEFITLMKEFPEVLQATQIAWDSLGSAQKEANIFLDTAQKKADRLRAGMQRLVSTYGDNLLPGMKAVLDGLNALINALIEAREIVILFSGAIAILGVKALITSGVMLKLAGAIKTLVFGASLLNPWLIALAAAATIGGIAWRAMRKEIDNTSGAVIESLQGSRNQVKSLEQQGDTLEWLAERYIILRDAQKGASSAAEAEKINDALQEIARSIQNVTKSVGLETVVNTDKWAESLDRVEKIIAGIRRAQEQSRQQSVRNAQTISNNTQLAIDFGKEFIKLMRLGNNANDAFDRAAKKVGVSSGSLKATLQGTGLVAERLGTTIPVSMSEAEEAVQNLEAVLKEARNIMKELRISDEFFGSLTQAVLSAEEFRDVMADIGRLNRQQDRDASHSASMAQVAGKHRLRAMEAERDGLITNIASLEQQRAVHTLSAKQFQDFTKLIDRRKEKLDGLNKAIELGTKQAQASGIRNALKGDLDIIRDRFKIEKDLASARKDNVGVQRLNIEQLEAERAAYKEMFFAARDVGLATDDYFDSIVALGAEIEIQNALLNNSIIPQERLKELAEKRKTAEKNLTEAIKVQNAKTERQIATARASGAADEEISRIKVANAQAIIALSKKFIPSIEIEKKLTEELKDAYNELNAAILSRNFADIEASILSISDQTSRQIDLAKAWGATGVQAAQMRIAGLEREREAITQSSMTFRQRFSAMLSLSKRMMDATHELAVADATAAKESADAWIKEYERRQKAWAKIIGKGLSKKGILETFERIQQEMVDRWVRSALDPVIKKLTDWEFTMLGIDPEQMRRQTENRNKMTTALVAGGMSVQRSITDGANYHASVIQSALQSKPASLGADSVQTPDLLNTALITGGESVGNSIATASVAGGDAIQNTITTALTSLTASETPLGKSITTALATGSMVVKKSIVEGADYHASAIRAIMKIKPTSPLASDDIRASQRLSDAAKDSLQTMKASVSAMVVNAAKAAESALVKIQTRIDETNRKQAELLKLLYKDEINLIGKVLGAGGEGMQENITTALSAGGTEVQDKLASAAVSGGLEVQKSIMAGATFHAKAINVAMRGSTAPSITIPGSTTSPPGTTIDDAVMAQLQADFRNGGASGGTGMGIGGNALSLLPFVATNIQDFTTGRGGGVRAAGSAIGAGVGMHFGVPPGVGAQAGLLLTSTIQDLKHWLEGKDEELKRPQAEALREQVGSAINRGTFGSAASVTNIYEFNVSMGFMLPEREGMRKAAKALKGELANIGTNIDVGT